MSSVPRVRRVGKALYYRDTLVGKGSDLAKAIEDNNAAKAEAIYQTCMVEYYKWFPRPNEVPVMERKT